MRAVHGAENFAKTGLQTSKKARAELITSRCMGTLSDIKDAVVWIYPELKGKTPMEKFSQSRRHILLHV